MVSVLVTVHNSEQYLRECLDSVCSQTYKDIEIICIDGGSNDSSPNILREYQNIDRRIRVINDSNTSYGHKINRGILESRGEYIAVIESDDIYEINMIEVLINVLNSNDELDFVNGNYRYFWDVNGIRHFLNYRIYQKQSYNCVIDNRKDIGYIEIMGRYWSGLYRKKFIIDNDIKLNESPGASFQDMSFNFLLSVLAGKTYHVDQYVYKYRMDNMLASIKDKSKILTIVYENEYLEHELVRRKIDNKYIWSAFFYCKYMGYDGNITNLLPKGRKILYEKYISELKKDIVRIPDYSVDRYPYANMLKLENKQKYLKEKEKQHIFLEKNNNTRLRFWKLLDEGNNFVIFGCGQRGRRYAKYFEKHKNQLLGYIDNDKKKWNIQVNAMNVYSLFEIRDKYPDVIYLIANATCAEKIHNQLIKIGVNNKYIIDSLELDLV